MPSEEVQNPMAPAQTQKKRRKTTKSRDNVSQYLIKIILPKYSSVQAPVLQPTSRSETDTSFVATLPLPPAPPASQLRLLPLPFVTPLPVDTLPHHNTQSVTLNPDPNDDGSSDGSLSSNSQNEADDSENSIEEYETSVDGCQDSLTIRVVRA